MINKKCAFIFFDIVLRCSCSSFFATFRFMVPGRISAWVIVVYERRQRFNERNVADLLQGLRRCARDVGVSLGVHIHLLSLVFIHLRRNHGVRDGPSYLVGERSGCCFRPTAKRRDEVQTGYWPTTGSHRLHSARGSDRYLQCDQAASLILLDGVDFTY